MAGEQPRGVVGKEVPPPIADGTGMRRAAGRPGVAGAPATDDKDRSAFSSWARREAWDGAWLMEAYTLAGKAGAVKETSGLSGSFLRMYLRHKIDPAVIKVAGEEIAASAEFLALSRGLEVHLNERAVNIYVRLPTAAETGQDARDYLLGIRHESGIAFRGKLNPVIGGVSSIEVAIPARVVPVAGLGGRAALGYTVRVTLKDTYDFDNDRRSNPTYDGLRRRWARQLAAAEYSTVKWNYHRELYFNSSGLGRTFVFAAFLYAIEKAGMTPGGLDWEVEIPMSGTITQP